MNRGGFLRSTALTFGLLAFHPQKGRRVPDYLLCEDGNTLNQFVLEESR